MTVTGTQFDIVLPNDGSRSAGLHVSDVIRAVALQVGILKGYDGPGFGQDRLCMALGIAWENWVSTLHPGILMHPGEYLKDGLALSPDGISFDVGRDGVRNMVHEFKVTWKSMRRSVEEEWMWLCQIKSYCYVVDTNLAQLHVLWINGDYRDVNGPHYCIYDLEFSERELYENWEMIKKSKSHAKPSSRR
jgi:hypothetical protein